MVARGGIEPPTRGFSVRQPITNHLNNQSLAALAIPHSSLIKAHFRHTQSGLGTQPVIAGAKPVKDGSDTTGSRADDIGPF